MTKSRSKKPRRPRLNPSLADGGAIRLEELLTYAGDTVVACQPDTDPNRNRWTYVPWLGRSFCDSRGLDTQLKSHRSGVGAMVGKLLLYQVIDGFIDLDQQTLLAFDDLAWCPYNPTNLGRVTWFRFHLRTEDERQEEATLIQELWDLAKHHPSEAKGGHRPREGKPFVMRWPKDMVEPSDLRALARLVGQAVLDVQNETRSPKYELATGLAVTERKSEVPCTVVFSHVILPATLVDSLTQLDEVPLSEKGTSIRDETLLDGHLVLVPADPPEERPFYAATGESQGSLFPNPKQEPEGTWEIYELYHDRWTATGYRFGSRLAAVAWLRHHGMHGTDVYEIHPHEWEGDGRKVVR